MFLKYTVDQTIKETVANAGNDLENTGTLVEIIIRQLRPVIFKAVQNALASAGATSIGKQHFLISWKFHAFQPIFHFVDPEQIVIKIIIEITPSIESGVQDEVTNVKQQNGELITIISDRLGPEIENLIKNIDFTPSISEELMEEILRVMPPR